MECRKSEVIKNVSRFLKVLLQGRVQTPDEIAKGIFGEFVPFAGRFSDGGGIALVKVGSGDDSRHHGQWPCVRCPAGSRGTDPLHTESARLNHGATLIQISCGRQANIDYLRAYSLAACRTFP